jgi:hypothetical protein
MKTTNKIPAIVFIAVLTAITVLFWVVLSIYRVFTDKPKIDVPSEVLEPINPTLDLQTLEKVQSSLYFEEGQTPAIQTVVTVASPIPTATMTATTSGEVNR